MFSRTWRRYRVLGDRLLWIGCLLACVVCFAFVFLSSYYLEDHREILACRGENKGAQEGYRTLIKPYATGDLDRQDSGIFQEVLAENFELKRTVNRLASFGPQRFAARSSDPNWLQERRRKYMQDIRAENLELKRTIKELVRLSPAEHLRSWQERSLKFITGEATRKDRAEKALSPTNMQNNGNKGSFPETTLLNCKEISKIQIKEELGRGYTKLTQRGVYNGREVAVKSVGVDSTDLHNCLKEKRAKLAADCLLFSRYKVMKELLLYQQLNHPNVVKLLGYCFQNDQDSTDIKSRGLTVVTELGTPLNLMTVVQLPWHQRFRIAVGLARLIYYFSVSPLGSLVIRDFQLIQFVTIESDIKISDLDDIGNEGRSCRSERDCVIGNQTYNITLQCVNKLCKGYNEKWNLYNLERFYFKMFLLPGAPHVLEDLENIGRKLALLLYDSKDLVRDLERVLGTLRNGQGLETYRPRFKYKAIPRADFPGRHDYECDHSISLVNCQSLHFDEIEAMRQCDDDANCKAFVMSYEKTWIGYKWVYFKNNSTSMVFSADNIVYIKVT